MTNKVNLTVQLKDMNTFHMSIFEEGKKIAFLDKTVPEMIDFVKYLNENINFCLFWKYEINFWQTEVLDRKSSYYHSFDGSNSIEVSFYGYFDEVKLFDETDKPNTYLGHKDIIKYFPVREGITIDYSSEGLEFYSKSKTKLFKYMVEEVYEKFIKPKHEEVSKQYIEE